MQASRRENPPCPPKTKSKSTEYAQRLVDGEILAFKWVTLAAQQQLDDLVRFKGKSSPFEFNAAISAKSGQQFRSVDQICGFIERLPHVKGPLAGERISLEPWQVSFSRQSSGG
jgi:phage terminase large subunit-like protein